MYHIARQALFKQNRINIKTLNDLYMDGGKIGDRNMNQDEKNDNDNRSC